MSSVDKVIKILDLAEYGLLDVPPSERQAAKQEVADFLENEIIRYVTRGESPVEGEGRFQKLNKDYAKKEKGGNTRANLQLEGDLLDSLLAKSTYGTKLKVGHEGGQAPKADGHNQLSAEAKNWANKTGFPKRRYIPDEDQTFKGPILTEVRSIIDEFKTGTTSQLQFEDNLATQGTAITTEDLLSEETLLSLMEKAYRDSLNAG